MSRSQTIAVGGTKSNRSLAIAAPTWTEMIPDNTSQTAGIRSGSRTAPLCQMLTIRVSDDGSRLARSRRLSARSQTQAVYAVAYALHGRHAMYSVNFPRCVEY
jgi:hypothetical protein